VIEGGELQMLIDRVPASEGSVFSREGYTTIEMAKLLEFIIQFGWGKIKVSTEPGWTTTHSGIDVGPESVFHIRANFKSGKRS
jgi:hypothetical protein